MSAFRRQSYVPYYGWAYSQNKDPYVVWDNAFDHRNDDQNSIDWLNRYQLSSHNNIYPTNIPIESEKSSPPNGCLSSCILSFFVLIITTLLMATVGISIYLSMITHVYSSDQVQLTKSQNSNNSITTIYSTNTTNNSNLFLLENKSVDSTESFTSIASIYPKNTLLKRTDIQRDEFKRSDLHFDPFLMSTTIHSDLVTEMNIRTPLTPTDSVTIGTSLIDGFVVSISAQKSAHHRNAIKMTDPSVESYSANNEKIIAKEDINQVFYDNQSMISTDLLTTLSTPCHENSFQCESGQCLSSSAHCNRIIECMDGSDEEKCSCAQYLKAEGQHKKLCDGIIDCYDFTDETNCSYCKENYICADSRICIEMSKVCDGYIHCPNGDDENECISLVPNNETIDKSATLSNPEGFLYIRRNGEWAPLCLDQIIKSNNSDILRDRLSIDLLKIEELGKAICRANSYADLQYIQIIQLNNTNFFQMKETNRKSLSLSMWSSLFVKSECQSKNAAFVKCQHFECGIRSVTNVKRGRIIGGESAVSASWPWQVAIYKEGDFQCGAVIVDSQWVLTAAHCCQGSGNTYLTARFGILRRANVLANPYEQLRRITHVFVHNHYMDKGFINDIALLRLDSPINFSKHVRPICMPSESDDVLKWSGQLCTTVGWGKLFEHGRFFPDVLQEVKLPVIPTEECRKRTLFLPLYKITENMFCAAYERGGRDTCLGDSGGPLMCQRTNGEWFLLGLTSNGDGCGRVGRPGVYTNVAKYKDWMQNIIKSELKEEIKTTCDGLRCPLGQCLKKHQICDQIIDCRDGSDETNC